MDKTRTVPIGSSKITTADYLIHGPILRQGFDLQVAHRPTPFPEHVLLSQQPQYAIIATTENPKTSTNLPFCYPHTRAKEEERNSGKRTEERRKENYMKTGT